MDGTLLTSDAAIARVWSAWSRRWGLEPATVTKFLSGRRAIDAISHFLPDLDEPGRSNEIDWVETREMQDTADVAELPGAKRFLESLPRDRWAIVTSAARRLALCRINAAGLPRPGVLVTAEDVERGKPDPAGYRQAAGLLGKDVRRCLIFEDAPAGIRAAVACGAPLAIVGTDPATSDFAPTLRLGGYVGYQCDLAKDGIIIRVG